MSSLIRNSIVIQGVQYTDVPGSWDHVGEEFGLKLSSTAVASGKRKIVVQQPREDEDHPNAHYRQIHRKAWSAQWGPDSWMSADLYRHLKFLHESATPFWIQYDDAMSINFDRLRCADGEGTVWLTTNNPIKPFGYTPTSPTIHGGGNLYVDGILYTSGFTVDDEYGVVTFDEAIDPEADVFFRYTWRCYVLLTQWQGTDLEDSTAQTVYVGSATFEQIDPDYTDDPWIGTQEGWDSAVKGVLPYPEAEPDPSTLICSVPAPPDSVSTDSRAGTAIDWTNPSNAKRSDSAYATVELDVDELSYLLTLENFLLEPVWAGAAIQKLRVWVLRHVEPANGIHFDVIDDYVKLYNGTDYGDNEATNTPVGASPDWVFYDIDVSADPLFTADIFNDRDFKLDLGWKIDCAHYDTGEFTTSYLYEGTAFKSKPDETETLEWGAAGENMSETVDETTQRNGSVIVRQEGVVTVRFTWAPGVECPPYVFANITSTAIASTDNPSQRTASVNNGFNDPTVWTAGMNEAESTGTHMVKIPVVANVAEYEVSVSASASRTYTSAESDDPTAFAEVSVTGVLVAAPTPTLYVDAVKVSPCWTGGAYTPPTVPSEPVLPEPFSLDDDVDFSKGWTEGAEPGNWIEGPGDRFPEATVPGAISTTEPFSLDDDVDFSKGWEDGAEPAGWIEGMGDRLPDPTVPGAIPTTEPFSLDQDVEFSKGWADGQEPAGWIEGMGDGGCCGCDEEEEEDSPPDESGDVDSGSGAIGIKYSTNATPAYPLNYLDSLKLADNAVEDHTTYEFDGTTKHVWAVYDLESAQQVTRLRASVFAPTTRTISFHYSDDGTAWTDATTSGFPVDEAGWQDINFTSIVGTAHRYWRIHVEDTAGNAARIGDYRLYNESGDQFLAVGYAEPEEPIEEE